MWIGRSLVVLSEMFGFQFLKMDHCEVIWQYDDDDGGGDDDHDDGGGDDDHDDGGGDDDHDDGGGDDDDVSGGDEIMKLNYVINSKINKLLTT